MSEDFKAMTPEEMRTYRDWLSAQVQLRTFRKIDFFEPYEKQFEFIELGKTKRERGLVAANRVGKSEVAAFEVACHMTGHYPDLKHPKTGRKVPWPGYRFERPNRWWLAGETGDAVRDVIQKKLCGDPGVVSSFGTGFIPKDDFAGRPSLARGTTNLYDTIPVKHRSGGVSTGTLKTYGEGRESFQGETLEGYWGDEESKPEIYTEARTRLATTKGLSMTTFTPLKGRTPLVIRFLDEVSPDRAVVLMGIYDAGHFTREEADQIIADYPAHEREARAFGVPQLGEGRVFRTPEEAIKEAAIHPLPVHWGKLWGVDFGIGHNFGAALIAWDRDYDVIHLLAVLRMKDGTPIQHVPAMRAIAAGVPVAWPHDGNDRDKGSGIALVERYKAPMPGMDGLRMLREHATWPEGGYSTELAVVELDERMKTGRFKAAAHLDLFWEEYRMYHREKGLLVKTNDDILSALYKAIMMKRFSQAMQIGKAVKPSVFTPTAAGTDFDLFTGQPFEPGYRN